MPLTQSMLRFQRATPTLDTTIQTTMTRPELSRSSTASSDTLPLDDDTIVVRNAPNGQLPTPDDSATDASSQASETLKITKVSQGQVKRVTRVSSNGQSQICLVENTEEGESGSRNVSGQTLVPSGSESSLLRNGITALNMDWALSQADLAKEQKKNLGIESLDTINVAADADVDSTPVKSLAKEKKEKAEKKRQERYQAEDEKATRRSSRASLLVRAGSIVTDITSSATTLGKRSHQVMERSKDRLDTLKRTGSLRPKSAVIESTTVVSSFEGPMSKKRRVSEPVPSKATPEAPVTVDATPAQPYKPKKYLASGLYAGQPRSFSGHHSKSKKRKSDVATEPPPKENSILPLPMFACERLLNHGADFKLPFDVFSPLRSGQPKPDEWRKMNKNTFVGDAAAYWRGDDPLLKQFRSLCGCSASTGCDEDCQNRIMFYECNESNCGLGSKCGNRNFADLKERVKKGGKYQIGVEVIKTPDRGYGVRSNRTFRPNQIIVEYSGEIITQEETERRMRTDYKDNSHYYLMLFDSALVIDATVRGSIARFVNHACEPNCRMEKWTVNGQPRMALFAGERGIMTGQELTYDYNFDPFCARNVQECRCGSIGCRGILGKRAPEKKNADKKDVEKKEKSKEKKGGVLAGAKRKLQAVLDESTSALNLNKAKKQKVSAKPASITKTKVTKVTKVTSKTPSKAAKRAASSPSKRNVSFSSITSSPGRKVVGKPRNSVGPNNTPIASRAVSSSSTKKSISTPAKSSASKKIKSRVQTPAAGLKSKSGSISSLKGLLGRSSSRAKASKKDAEDGEALIAAV